MAALAYNTILALGKLKQEDPKFETSLGFRARLKPTRWNSLCQPFKKKLKAKRLGGAGGGFGRSF